MRFFLTNKVITTVMKYIIYQMKFNFLEMNVAS